jgi:hypothetical protein
LRGEFPGESVMVFRFVMDAQRFSTEKRYTMVLS